MDEKQPAIDQVLGGILRGLQSDDAAEKGRAIREATRQTHSTRAILHALERIAAQDKRPALRRQALEALASPLIRGVRLRITTLNSRQRQMVVREAEQWEQDGLISPQILEVLRERYLLGPAKRSQPLPGPEPVPVEPGPAGEPAPAPAASLTQTLFSETSITIALYLGAFFVIAAALILAALIEVVRLPILLVVTTMFGAGALALRKKLPQPSFILFIVCTAMLPIDAGVLADLTNLRGDPRLYYWFGVSLALSAVWAYSTFLYRSRLFALAACAALMAASVILAPLTHSGFSHFILAAAAVSGLINLGFLTLVRRALGENAIKVIFVILQVLYAIWWFLAVPLFMLIAFTFQPQTQRFDVWLLIGALGWLGIAGFYSLSQRLQPFVLFPWAAALALSWVPWYGLGAFHADVPVRLVVLLVWAALLLALRELSARGTSSMAAYQWPALSASLVAAIGVAAYASDLSGPGWRLATFACLGAIYLGANLLRPAWHTWTIALVSFLMAYLAATQLDFIEALEIYPPYLTLIACTVLALPDLILGIKRPASGHWRWPPRVLAGSIVLAFVLLYLPELQQPTWVDLRLQNYAMWQNLDLAFAFTLAGALIGVHAIRTIPWHWYAALILFVLGTLAINIAIPGTELWLPILTAVAIPSYIAGFLLRDREPHWSLVLRTGALGLAVGLGLAALYYPVPGAYWYLLALTGLFTAETLRISPWGELPGMFMLSAAYYLIAAGTLDVSHLILILGFSLLWLLADAIMSRAHPSKRPWMQATRIGAGLLTATCAILCIGASGEAEAWIAPLILAIVLGLLAWFHRNRMPAYAALGLTTYAGFFLLQSLEVANWLLPLMILPVVYYALGFGLPAQYRSPVLTHTGLTLASLLSLCAPFLPDWLAASAAVALAATLWGVHAFRTGQVWMGFPACGLYLFAYFLILSGLQIHQPQYYSVGIAMLGLLMHYLLVRSGSRTAAFLTGMVSQLALLTTTYIQMVDTENIWYFVALFVQSLIVLGYGIVIRSRSLVFTPIAILVIGVATVVYSALRGISTVILIGCTGILLILFGIGALLMRERLATLRGRMKDWSA